MASLNDAFPPIQDMNLASLLKEAPQLSQRKPDISDLGHLMDYQTRFGWDERKLCD
jgi:hypothetical protein